MRSTATTVLCTFSALVLAALAGRYFLEHWLLGFVYSLQIELSVAVITMCAIGFFLGPKPLPAIFVSIAAIFLIHGLVMRSEFSATALADIPRVDSQLRVLSFNIESNNGNDEAIADAVLRSSADVAVILEAEPLAHLLSSFHHRYPYRAGCGTLSERCDTLVLSRYPLENARFETMSMVSPERVFVATIDHVGGKVTLAAVHLTKPYYDGFFELEIWHLEELLNKISMPLIVVGDFNSEVIAPAMQRFMRRTRLMNHRSEPSTWPVWAGKFGISIDHVFVRQPTAFGKVETLKDSYGSNHQGLFAEIWLPGSAD